MAFSKALYYPWIDIDDESWLKNAVLYWDTIQTIVPASFSSRVPYHSSTALELYERGVLQPLFVQPNMDIIEDLTDDIVRYFDTNEGKEIFFKEEITHLENIHLDKLSPAVANMVSIHRDKLPEMVRDQLSKGSNPDEWIQVDPHFADFYMTLLATRLAERNSLGPLTDTPSHAKLSLAARLDTAVNFRHDEYLRHRQSDIGFAQGMLVDCIIERIELNPATPVSKLLKFKADHAEELNNFRSKIDKLTGNISIHQDFTSVLQDVKLICDNEVIPAITALGKSLDREKLEWQTKNIININMIIPHIGLGALYGLSGPRPIYLGSNMSCVASTALYNTGKAINLSINPYSYIVSAARRLHN